MAANWKKAFHFPMRLGFNVESHDFVVARNALTATSRLIINITIHASTRSRAMSIINADVTSTLSAMGSRNRPNEDSTLRRRAIKPSKKSVNEATKNIAAATAEGKRPGKKRSMTIGGTRSSLPKVRKLGKCLFMISFERLGKPVTNPASPTGKLPWSNGQPAGRLRKLIPCRPPRSP